MLKLPEPGFCALDGATVGVAVAAVTGDRTATPAFDAVDDARVGGAVDGARVGDAVDGATVGGAVDGATVGGAVGGAVSGSGVLVAGTTEGGRLAFCVGAEVDVETSEGCSVILKILELFVGSSVNGGAVIVGILLLIGEDVGILPLFGEDVGRLLLVGEGVGILPLFCEGVGILLLVGEGVGILLLLCEGVGILLLLGEDVGILLLIGEDVETPPLLFGEDVGILLLVGEGVPTGNGFGTDDGFLANCVGSSVSSEAQVGDSVSVESNIVGTILGESELRIVGWTERNGVGAGVEIAGGSDFGSESELPIFANLDVSSVMGSSLVYIRVKKMMRAMITMQITAPTRSKHLGTGGTSRSDFCLFIEDLGLSISEFGLSISEFGFSIGLSPYLDG